MSMGEIETTGITDVDWLDAKVCDLSNKLEMEQQRNSDLAEALGKMLEVFDDYRDVEPKDEEGQRKEYACALATAAIAANGGGDV